MLLDTHAWIEFFIGSEKGKRIGGFLEKNIYTNIITFSEIAVWCLKNKLNTKEYIDFIKRTSTILELEEEICLLAGKINFEIKKTIKDFGMIDSLIYASGKIYNMKIVTGDKHFENLEDVIFI